MWHKGPCNSLADIEGVAIGHAHDAPAKTGTTLVCFDAPATASVSIMGQAPGTREMALLDPARTISAIDALVLSGGSAFGLAAADAVVTALAKAGRGFAVGPVRVPIVPAAILFDLLNGGTKPDDLSALYRTLGAAAIQDSEGHRRETAEQCGAIGAGYGATTGAGVGGLGTASARFEDSAPSPLAGRTVAALVAVNAVGSPFLPDGQTLRAGHFEQNREFGGASEHASGVSAHNTPVMKGTGPGENTTIGCVVTDAPLDKRGCHMMAVAGQDGLAAAIFPAHTALDGDLVVGASVTTAPPITDPVTIATLQSVATATMARAIGRAIGRTDAGVTPKNPAQH